MPPPGFVNGRLPINETDADLLAQIERRATQVRAEAWDSDHAQDETIRQAELVIERAKTTKAHTKAKVQATLRECHNVVMGISQKYGVPQGADPEHPDHHFRYDFGERAFVLVQTQPTKKG